MNEHVETLQNEEDMSSLGRGPGENNPSGTNQFAEVFYQRPHFLLLIFPVQHQRAILKSMSFSTNTTGKHQQEGHRPARIIGTWNCLSWAINY
jgi:hypothetical protein